MKMFDRHSSLAGNNIMNYKADVECKFMVLLGIEAKEKRVAGQMQLYSTERKVSQLIEGHAACFTQFKMEGNPHPSNLFCFSLRSATGGGKMRIVVLPETPQGNKAYPEKAIDVVYPTEADGDFPTAMQASSKQGILYMLTKFGYVHIFELGNANSYYMAHVPGATIILTAEYTPSSGIICVDRSGQVITVSLNPELLPTPVKEAQGSNNQEQGYNGRGHTAERSITFCCQEVTVPAHAADVEKHSNYEVLEIPPGRFPQPEIPLVSIDMMSEVERSVFEPEGITALNRMQSAVYHIISKTDDNVLVSAPTGSGKTNVARLALLKAKADAERERDYNCKIAVYIAPMRALTGEKQRELETSLARLGLKVLEITGEANPPAEEIKTAQVLVTTPEKWVILNRRSTAPTLLYHVLSFS